MSVSARSIEIVEEIWSGWGYDSAGRWHRGAAELVPTRKISLLTENDPLAPARGSLWGLLSSFIFFWLPVGAAAFLWRRK
jgi:hypothetical protein